MPYLFCEDRVLMSVKLASQSALLLAIFMP